MKSNASVIAYDASLKDLASTFDCGSNIFYNRFLLDPRALDPNFGKTYVCLTDDRTKIVGYYNIGVGDVEVNIDNGFVSGNTEYKSVKAGGAIHINMFALDKAYRSLVVHTTKEGYQILWSDYLLDECIQRILHIRDRYIGFTFITLTASTEGEKLYKRHLFSEMDDDMSFSYEETEKSGKGIDMYLPIDEE